MATARVPDLKCLPVPVGRRDRLHEWGIGQPLDGQYIGIFCGFYHNYKRA